MIAKSMLIALSGMAILTAAGLGIFTAWAEDAAAARWYSPAQVSAGEALFIQNCLTCHGEQGRGAVNWRQRQRDGSFPPPPLNGSAHTWHHPMAVLRRTIKNGGVPLGGTMPAFGEQLKEQEIDSIIAYFQSQWPDEIYQVWDEKVNSRY